MPQASYRSRSYRACRAVVPRPREKADPICSTSHD